MSWEDDWDDIRGTTANWASNREKNFLNRFCAEAHLVDPIAYDYRYGEGFTVYTTHPGWLIGKHGALIEKYTAILQEEFGPNEKIKLKEIRGGFANLNNKEVM